MKIYSCEILSVLPKSCPLSCVFAKKFMEGIVLCRQREKFPKSKKCAFMVLYKLYKIGKKKKNRP